jgi:hypothetical protein
MDQRHFIELLVKYLVRFEFLSDSTGDTDEKEEYRPQIIKLIMNLFLKELKVSEEVGDNMIYISWILYSYQYLNKLEMIEFLCRYLELVPPTGYMTNGAPKEGNSFETDANPLNKSFSRSPYSPSHHLIWKMLASVLGPLAPEDRLLNQSIVAQHCEITGFVKNSVLANKSFVDLRKDNNIPIKSEGSTITPNHLKMKTELENGSSEAKNLKNSLTPRKELWQSTVLSGSMLNDFTSSVLPFECEELIQSFSAAETLTNSTTSSSVQSPSILFSQFPEILLNEEVTEDSFSLLEEDLLRAHHLLAVCEKVFHSANSQSAPMSSQMNSQSYFSQSATAENIEDENNMEGRNQFVSLLHSQLSVLRNLKEEKDERNSSTLGEVSSSSSTERISLPKPLLFKALLHFVYHRRSVSFFRDFTEFLQQQNEDAKSQDTNYLIEKVLVSLRTASFFGLQTESRKWKKELQRNHTRETIFILGKNLLELISFQILVAAHMLTQDCFLATRGIQLLFQHYLYYANKLKEIEVTTTKANGNLSSSGSITEDGATTDLSPIIRQKRDHVVRCLSFLHQNGINLSRATKLAFDWGTRNISMTTSHPQYFVVDENNELKSGSSSYKAHYHK